jgi:hypothetical protein
LSERNLKHTKMENMYKSDKIIKNIIAAILKSFFFFLLLKMFIIISRIMYSKLLLQISSFLFEFEFISFDYQLIFTFIVKEN